MQFVPYNECYPDGWTKDTPLASSCVAADVEAFPTWQINGQKYEGELTIQELSDILDGVSDIEPSD